MTAYLSTKKAAEYADVHPQTIRQWVKEGHLSQYWAGSNLRIKVAELEAYLARKTPANEKAVDEVVVALVP